METVNEFISVNSARRIFNVSGEGLTAAVLDTGLNVNHVDFSGRVIAGRNFTDDNNGDPGDVSDGNGHGTNVCGIIAANGDHTGIAPGSNILPIKVLRNKGGGSFALIQEALQWVIDNREEHSISATCVSLGDGGNYTDDKWLDELIQDKIRQLRDFRVPVMLPAGNDYHRNNSRQGMSYPAIVRECISVSAVYNTNFGSTSYGGGAKAFSTRAGQIAPFAQRLHPSVNKQTHTDIFAPGAPITSSGMKGEHGESTQHGSAQATAVLTGLVLLIQELHQRITGDLPEVDDIVRWLRQSAVTIFDGDDEDDNVENTFQKFLLADATSTLYQVRRELQPRLLERMTY